MNVRISRRINLLNAIPLWSGIIAKRIDNQYLGNGFRSELLT
ncbi:MAG: hypothetical protein ACI9DJ_002508 [Algoriphagus sp.]|jgi:hypothetical protein